MTARSAVVRGATRAMASRAFGLVLLLASLAWPARARAEDVPVPVGLQAELLAKVAAYDRNIHQRAGDRVRVALVVRPGDADSTRVATHMQSALAQIDAIAGLPHEEQIVPYAGAAALAALVRAQRIAIVYVSAGFADEVEAIRASFVGVDVLSVAAVPDYVPRGIVLGFDLVSGKPKLLVHLGQAKKQNVALKSEVLKIMRVYE